MRIHVLWVADHVTMTTVEHVHDYYQMIYCKKAGGSLNINGVQYESEAGDIYFIRPMEPHSMKRGKNMWLVEMKFLAEDLETVELLDKFPSVFRAQDDFEVRMSLRDIVKEALSQAAYSNESANAATELLLIRLLRNFVDNTCEPLQARDFCLSTRNVDVAGRIYDVQFLKVIDYIEKHLAEPITLDDLSAQIHFNKSYMIERFKEIWGVPPMKYVNLLRVERAKELLTTTTLSVTDIAETAGFQSVHYFSRFFKEKEHMTPQEYRKKHADVQENIEI